MCKYSSVCPCLGNLSPSHTRVDLPGARFEAVAGRRRVPRDGGQRGGFQAPSGHHFELEMSEAHGGRGVFRAQGRSEDLNELRTLLILLMIF